MRADQIKAVREFSRFYTNIIGLLNQHLPDSQFSLPEARILYELRHHQPCTASHLLERLSMDRGYMSRILAQFEKKKIILRKRSKEDGRAYYLSLSVPGEKIFARLDAASHRQVEALLKPMTAVQRKNLLHHMKEIMNLLTLHQPDNKNDIKANP
jgi:DNA-binding MarR family transcriptional regulator